jgi:hypothetical protein
VLAGPLPAKLLDEQREAIEAAVPPSTRSWLPAGEVPSTLHVGADAVEDPVTVVAEPDRIEPHLRELDRLEALDPERILPAHGDSDVIAAGGDDVGIIEAMRVYPRALLAGDRRPVREILEGPLRHGWSTGTRPMRPCTR